MVGRPVGGVLVTQEHWGIHGPDGNEFNETYPTREAALKARDAIARQAGGQKSKYTLWCTRLGDCPECGPKPVSTVVTTTGKSKDGLFVITKTIITTTKPVRYYEAVLGGRSGQLFPHTILCELLTDRCDQMHEPCEHCWRAKMEDL
jgi:hypothetical protein